LKISGFVGVVALALVLGGVVHADTTGGDGRIVIGGGPMGSPPCTSFQASTNSEGAIVGDQANGADGCVVTGSTATVLAFAIPDALTNGGLTCASSLTTIGWTESQTTLSLGGVQVDECYFTAPTPPSWVPPQATEAYDAFAEYQAQEGICNLGDFLLGIPVGCDITFGTDGDAPNQLFAENAPFDVATTSNPSSFVPFPEPGSVALMLLGLATLPLLRRRLAQQE
jgi:hypothetical protein